MVFCIADPAEHFTRSDFHFRVARFLQNLLDQALLIVRVVDRKVTFIAKVMDFPAQKTHTKGMEC